MAARARYFSQSYQLNGSTVQIVPNADITLYEAGTSTPVDPAEIFAGATGGTTRPNPFQADAFGNIEFFLASARRVKIVASGVGVGPLEVDYEPVLWDPGDQIVHTPGDQIVAKGADLGTGMRVQGTSAHLHVVNSSGVSNILAKTAANGTAVLKLQDGVAGGSIESIQSAWDGTSVHGLWMANRKIATQGNGIVGSTLVELAQTFLDRRTTVGADTTTLKVVQHASGDGNVATSTFRGMEMEVGRYKATSASSSYAQYGELLPAVFGSTRGISIGLFHDPLIVASPLYTFGLVGVNIENSGAGAADGRTWASGGNKATAGVNIHGAGGFKYGIIWSGTAAPDQSLDALTGRVFHIREQGGIDGIFYQTSNTTGTGIMLAAAGGGGRSLHLLAAGSAVGAPHAGKMTIYDGTAGVHVLSVGMNAADATKGQVGVIGGTDAFPGLVGYGDLNSGFVWDGSDVVGLSIGGTRKVTWNSSGLGVGGTPAAPLHIFGAGAIRVESSSNWQTTVGAAGGASALPATPLGYFKLNLGGSTVVLPYYLAA